MGVGICSPSEWIALVDRRRDRSRPSPRRGEQAPGKHSGLRVLYPGLVPDQTVPDHDRSYLSRGVRRRGSTAAVSRGQLSRTAGGSVTGTRFAPLRHLEDDKGLIARLEGGAQGIVDLAPIFPTDTVVALCGPSPDCGLRSGA